PRTPRPPPPASPAAHPAPRRRSRLSPSAPRVSARRPVRGSRRCRGRPAAVRSWLAPATTCRRRCVRGARTPIPGRRRGILHRLRPAFHSGSSRLPRVWRSCLPPVLAHEPLEAVFQLAGRFLERGADGDGRTGVARGGVAEGLVALGFPELRGLVS